MSPVDFRKLKRFFNKLRDFIKSPVYLYNNIVLHFIHIKLRLILNNGTLSGRVYALAKPKREKGSKERRNIAVYDGAGLPGCLPG